VLGLFVAASLWAARAEAAPVYDWYFAADWPVTFDLHATGGSYGDGTNLGGNDVAGVMLGLGTAFHVGFGLDIISGRFRMDGSASSTLTAMLLNALLDVPMERWTLNVGASWGLGNFSPQHLADSLGGYDLTSVNFSGALIRVGRKISKRMDVHVGYQEFYGKGEKRWLGQSPMLTESFKLAGRVASLGARLDF